MALYVCLHYEDGSRSPVTPVEIGAPGEPVEVTIPSMDNGLVTAIEVTDQDDELVSYTQCNMWLRVVDAICVTIVPPTGGWPGRTYFSKEVDEQAVVEMRQRLQGMAERLHNRQQQIHLRDARRNNEWVERGFRNMPTGDYL